MRTSLTKRAPGFADDFWDKVEIGDQKKREEAMEELKKLHEKKKANNGVLSDANDKKKV